MISPQVNKDVPEHKCQHLVASIKVKLHDIFSLIGVCYILVDYKISNTLKMLHRFADLCIRIFVFSSGRAYLC